MDELVRIAIAQMAAQLEALNFTPSHIIVTDHDYAVMRINGVDVDGRNGGPVIIPICRLKN